jgi:hypothetical protein
MRCVAGGVALRSSKMRSGNGAEYLHPARAFDCIASAKEKIGSFRGNDIGLLSVLPNNLSDLTRKIAAARR